ncbi:MAG: sigma-E factor negative regulatory protein, partial [Thiohalomonadales bacterium]
QGIDKEPLMDKLCHEHELKQRWSRYQLVQDSIRRDLPPAVDLNFSTRIMQALESEPAILAPVISATTKKDNTKNSAAAGDSPQHANVLAALHTRTGKRIAGFAVAATVAAVSVVSFQYNFQQQTNGSSGLADAGLDSTSNVVAITNRSRAPSLPTIFSSTGQEAVASSASVENSRMISSVSPNRNSMGPFQSPRNRSLASKMTPAMQVRRGPSQTERRRPLNVSNPTISAQLHKYLINHSQNVSGTQLQGVMPYARIVSGRTAVSGHATISGRDAIPPTTSSTIQQNLPRQ